MNTINQTALNRPAAINEEILQRKRSELNTCIKEYFDIGGLDQPCSLLKEVLYGYTANKQNHPSAKLNFQEINNKVFCTMELLSFISVLYQKYTEVRRTEEPTFYNS
jgi:hypothetical protein